MIKEHPLLISAVREQLAGEVPRMIVLDTLNKSLVGSESKDVDMAAYIVAAEALRDAFDCVVIIIHHCGYDETHPRGHTSLTGAVDAEFEVVREGMLVTVKNVTMRDGPEGFEIRSHAEVVEVGEDINGKALTSLVITPTDAPAAVGQKRGRGRPDVATPIFTDAMRAALAERGARSSRPGASATEHVVSESEVRARFEVGYPAGESRQGKGGGQHPQSLPARPARRRRRGRRRQRRSRGRRRAVVQGPDGAEVPRNPTGKNSGKNSETIGNNSNRPPERIPEFMPLRQ